MKYTDSTGIVYDNVLAFGVLVTLDYIIVCHFSMFRTDLFVSDSVVATGMQLVQGHLCSCGTCCIRLDGHRHKAELNKSFPACSKSHDTPPRLLPAGFAELIPTIIIIILVSEKTKPMLCNVRQ